MRKRHRTSRCPLPPLLALLRLLLVTLVAVPGVGRADEVVAVPVPLQMELLTKVAAYDRNLPERSPQVVKVLVLVRTGSSQSSHVALQAVRSLEGKTVANRPLEVTTLSFTDGPALRGRVKTSGVSIIYATPGFTDSELDALASALAGLSVLSAGALPEHTRKGVVVAFDLVSGKPKILVHLQRARAQNVQLSSQLLKLVRVVE